MNNLNVSRRQFLSTTAKGLVVVPGLGLSLGRFVSARESRIAETLTPFIRILPNNSITFMIHKQEMGQGVRTSMAALLAEEMNVDLAQINIYSVDNHENKFGRMDTGGSGSVRRAWSQLRTAGAAAKEMLITTAAKRWKVSIDKCSALNGYVINNKDNQRLSYGELATEAARLPVPKAPQLKSASEFSILGKALKDIDSVDIVTGKMKYGADVILPNCRHASIIRCPATTGKIKSYDATEALAHKDVVLVKPITSDLRINGNRAGIGVVAKTRYGAIKAKQKIAVDWDIPDAISNGEQGVYQYLDTQFKDKALVINKKGNPDTVAASEELEAHYTTPAQHQGYMEPMVCIAEVKEDYCELWVGHQFTQTVSKRVAELLHIPVENVVLHPLRIGGSFGRKYENDFVLEAVQLAKSVVGPVKVQWSREEDMQFGFYQTPSVHNLRCKLNTQGVPISWEHSSVTATYDRNQDKPMDSGDAMGCQEHMLWDIKDYRILTKAVPIDINRGAHRSVGNVSAQFAIGSFKDEVAQHAGDDSISYFLRNLGKDRVLAKGYYESWIPEEMQYDIARLRACIERVADISGWFTREKTASGVGYGFSAFRSQMTYCATVVRVKDTAGKVRVTHIFNVTDCGQVVDLNGAQQQVVGCLIYGLSCAMREKIYSEQHQVKQSNFHQYLMARMSDIPIIESEFIASTRHPTGLGEPAVSGVAPALANAISSLTGKRIRSLPLADHIEFV